MFDNLLSIRFEYPYFLLLIFLFIFCAFFFKAKTPTYIIPHLDIFVKNQISTNFFQALLKYITITGMIIALASPYTKLKTQLTKNDGIDIVLSLDTSGSMKELGFNPSNPMESRFTVVKDIVKEFIPKRINDNISIVVFETSVMMVTHLALIKMLS